MNILTPIARVEDVEPLVKSGASEFFAGFINREWIDLYNHIETSRGNLQFTLNRRNGLWTNFIDETELQKLIQTIEQYRGTLFITLNAPFYTEKMFISLRRYLQKISSYGVKNLIVSDVGVMQLICEEFPEFEITVSCLAEIISCEAVEFYKQFNIKRVVFPRHISIQKLINIAKKFPEIEFEFFGLCEKCLHDDGNCRSMHNLGAFCMECWNGKYESVYGNNISNSERNAIMINEAFYKNWINGCTVDENNNYGCSLCAIASLSKVKNISSVKLSGRGKSIDFIVKQVKMTRSIIEMCECRNAKIDDIRSYVKKQFCESYCEDFSHCIMRGE